MEAFTDLEREILLRVASGESARDIAAAVLMPKRTVVRHIDTCKHKLGAKNNAQLVARAISTGFLLS